MAMKKVAPKKKAGTKAAAAPKKAPRSAVRAGESPFPIVGIGASAGGLEAFEGFFTHMPANSGMAFVLVTHLAPNQTSLLPELLQRRTKMEVHTASDGTKVLANHVYVSPPHKEVAILNGTLQLMETAEPRGLHLPIDSFFRALGQDQRDKAMCIILSGTGTDGTLGLKAVKGESGMAMVQDPRSAKFAGMPESAIGTGLVDYVLPVAEMPDQLVKYARGPFLTVGKPSAEIEAPDPASLQKIFILLRGRTGHDLSLYKFSTIRRRIERRMNVHQIGAANHYIRYLQENPHELDILFKELLIGVTSFFRDPEAFAVLAKSALPKLLKSRPDNQEVRVWVPGCSTGEEAYSIAILVHEYMEAAGKNLNIQVFATDLDTQAIETARLGRYPDGIAVDVSAERLRRYFAKENGYYRIRKEIRETVVFAPQNAIKDPPFTKLDILSCRNLLIYLESELQKRLLPAFHYALRPGGVLFLGSSETIGEFTDLFAPVDKKWKIFTRRPSSVATHGLAMMPGLPAVERGALLPPIEAPPGPRNVRVLGQIEKMLLKRFVPPSVVVSERGDIVHIHGRTGRFLELPPGEPSLNIFEMAREGLQFDLESAIRKATTQDEEVVHEGGRIKTNGDHTPVTVTVRKIAEPETLRGLLFV